MNKKARLFAFYLPQYHPVKENDDFWGKGFTEWTNMTKAKPLFKGHEQPLLAGDLGYYDLRVAETREDQSRMAQEYGIDSFCYWHYWFGNGKQVLERIFDEVLASGEPSMPFCLGWANESWTGRWHGLDNEFIFEQTYPGLDDYTAHFNHVLPALKDKRYSTVNGKPIFLVYRPQYLPNGKEFIDHWRKLAADAGLPGIHFIGVDNDSNCLNDGFDARIPNAPWLGPIEQCRLFESKHKWAAKIQKKEFPEIYDYRGFVDMKLSMELGEKEYPLVIPNWDNTPRSGIRGKLLFESSPDEYGRWLQEAVGQVQVNEPEERIVFIKSWNEWAEGNHLEPDRKWGKAYLEETLKAIKD